MWKSKFYCAFVLNLRVDLNAIDATPARWRGDAGSSPLDGARTAASSPRNDVVKNYRVHPTHWLISTQARTRWPWRAPSAREAPVDVVGWSLGGLVAQELCCVAPSEVRRAVLASTSPGGDDLAELISRDFFDVFDGWADDDTREGEAARRRAAAAAFVHASPERWVSNNVDALKADVDAFVGVRRAAAAIRGQKACALAPFPDCSRLPEKRYLVLHGDVDPVVDAALAARLAERAPGAKLLLLAGVGHRAWAQEPDEWCARVLDFLDAA